jgi:hypothetical protein
MRRSSVFTDLDVSTLDGHWRPVFNAGDRDHLIALEYLGSENRMGLIYRAHMESMRRASDDTVVVGKTVTLDELDDITLKFWFEYMTTAEREVRERLGEDGGSKRATEIAVGSPRSTWQPTPATRMCWSVNHARPFRKGHLIDIPPRFQPTAARLKANLRRSQKSSRLEGVKYPGFVLAALDDGYPYDHKALATLCEQVDNDLMLNEPTVNLNTFTTHVLMWAARCYREGVRP